MFNIIDLNFLGQTHTIAAFLLETTEGPVLFETGPYSTYPSLVAGLNRAGYRQTDLKHVFLSHIHLDHAGAAWALSRKGATVYVHPAGHQHLAAPSRLMASASRIYGDDMDRLWGRMKAIEPGRLRKVKHEETFKIGEYQIKALHTPGHAVHHIAWQVGDQLIAGDVAGVKVEGGIVVPPCPPPDINIEDWQASLALIRSLPLQAIWLTHFGKVEAIESHLDELETRLLAYAQWIKKYYEEGLTAAELTPRFKTFVEEELLENGVFGDQLDRYNKANPPWMSVEGLMRYWRKKEA